MKKNRETVRNIYDELSKTNDYKERIEIEKFAMISESVRRRKWLTETFMKRNRDQISNDITRLKDIILVMFIDSEQGSDEPVFF